jgi:hypothetical protein
VWHSCKKSKEKLVIPVRWQSNNTRPALPHRLFNFEQNVALDANCVLFLPRRLFSLLPSRIWRVKQPGLESASPSPFGRMASLLSHSSEWVCRERGGLCGNYANCAAAHLDSSAIRTAREWKREEKYRGEICLQAHQRRLSVSTLIFSSTT